MNARAIRLFLNRSRRYGNQWDLLPMVVRVNGKEIPVCGIGIEYSLNDYTKQVVKIELDY